MLQTAVILRYRADNPGQLEFGELPKRRALARGKPLNPYKPLMNWPDHFTIGGTIPETPMQETWRWFGPHDTVSLAQIRQAGASGVVTALDHIPTGEVWPIADIDARRQLIADHGHAMGEERDDPNVRPGYSYTGRMKGLAELRGVIYALRKVRQ